MVVWYKRMEAFNGASIGIHLEKFPQFDGAPSFPHGMRGVFVNYGAGIGKICCEYHQVTSGSNVTLGDNVEMDAGCIVVEDVPDNATVVMNKPRIIISKGNEQHK